MKTKMQYCYGIGVFLLLLSLFINSCTQQNFVNISKSKSVGDIYLASNNRDSLNIIDSLTTGFFSQSFAVDAPHSNAIHSIAFYRTNMFDYRIMDERYKESGRDDPDHPMHGLFTGLKVEYEQVSDDNSE